jgi:hypothetical protein
MLLQLQFEAAAYQDYPARMPLGAMRAGLCSEFVLSSMKVSGGIFSFIKTRRLVR